MRHDYRIHSVCDWSSVLVLTFLPLLQVQFNGMTPLGTSLNQKVIQPFLFNGIQQRILQKPILVIVITDGEPTGEPKTAVAQAIKNAKNMTMSSQYGPGAIAFEFAQVGSVLAKLRRLQGRSTHA